MNSRCMRTVAAVAVFLLLGSSVFAQQSTKKRWYAPSLDGATGLFKVWDAEALRHGETNWTFGYDMVTRDPGRLKVGRAPAGVAIGLFDRLEIFEAMDVVRHITEDRVLNYRRLPGSPVSPARIGPAPGVVSFSQVAPFIDVPRATGRSDVHLGLKFNILSERRGNPLSLGLAGFGTLPGQRTATGLSRGLSSGAFQGGFAMLLSKSVGEVARLHLNVGTNLYSDPQVNDVVVAKLQNEFIYRVGVEMPVYHRVRFIGEMNGIQYYGDGMTGLNPNSPLDAIFGLRVYAKEWLSFAAGYQPSFRQQKAAYNGFVVQGALGTRRNDPPTVTCSAAKSSILQDDTTVIRANAVDPDGDKLTYTWSTTGGKISDKGDTATFDATGVAPGKYTVTVNVSDGKHQVSCTTEITVLKRNIAPTARIEPTTFSLTQGESQDFRCIGSDANNDPLTYSWTVNGQKLAAAGPQITFGTEGRNPGNYTVTCTVSDGEATGSASATGTVKERIKPNQPPTVECLTTSVDVASGASRELSVKASDPDGDKLTYSWTSTGGTVNGNGDTATFNAAGVKAGSYTVTVGVDDGRGGKASCSMTVNVSERLSITRDKCGFFMEGQARVDNCAKAILDDLAVRMKNDPKLRANVIGYTDDSRLEKRRKGLGEKRAKAVAAYLEKQGVEASRLTVTDGGPNNPVGDNKKAAGRKLNRRVEIELSVR